MYMTRKPTRRNVIKDREPITKKVPMRLAGFSGTSHDLIRSFACNARAVGITQDQIEHVVGMMTSDDYSHVVQTIAPHVVEA